MYDNLQWKMRKCQSGIQRRPSRVLEDLDVNVEGWKRLRTNPKRVRGGEKTKNKKRERDCKKRTKGERVHRRSRITEQRLWHLWTYASRKSTNAGTMIFHTSGRGKDLRILRINDSRSSYQATDTCKLRSCQDQRDHVGNFLTWCLRQTFTWVLHKPPIPDCETSDLPRWYCIQEDWFTCSLTKSHERKPQYQSTKHVEVNV